MFCTPNTPPGHKVVCLVTAGRDTNLAKQIFLSGKTVQHSILKILFNRLNQPTYVHLWKISADIYIHKPFIGLLIPQSMEIFHILYFYLLK